MLDVTVNRSVSTIADIASKLEIRSDFTIAHERYLPVKVAVGVVNSLQQLPIVAQDNYRRSQLQNFLYQAYFSGSNAHLANLTTTSPQQLENNTSRGVNIKFDQHLRANNCGAGFFDSGWQITAIDPDGSLKVSKDRLSLYVKRDRHLRLTQKSAPVGGKIDILMPSNTIDDRYYLAIADAGKTSSKQTVEIYCNVSTAGAIELMKWVTQEFNQLKLPFTFKVLHDPDCYETCHDVTILMIDRRDYPKTEAILQRIYHLNTAHFRPFIPAFTKLLASGLSIAESPDLTAVNAENFGKYCCKIIADALLTARQQNDESTANRQALIYQSFTQQGLDWERPYLNSNSEDIYTSFDQ